MAQARIEWGRLNALNSSAGAAVNQPFELFGAAEVVEVGPTALAIAAPSFGENDDGLEPSAFVRVKVLLGTIVFTWGDAPIATEASGWRVDAGNYALAPVKTGQGVSLIEASTPPAATAIVPIHSEAVGRAGVIAAGGTAQDLMPANPDRNGWLIQNQSAAALYIRTKGDGSIVATTDASSLQIPPGGYYEPPKITLEALSIIGFASGQTFFAEEW